MKNLLFIFKKQKLSRYVKLLFLVFIIVVLGSALLFLFLNKVNSSEILVGDKELIVDSQKDKNVVDKNLETENIKFQDWNISVDLPAGSSHQFFRDKYGLNITFSDFPAEITLLNLNFFEKEFHFAKQNCLNIEDLKYKNKYFPGVVGLLGGQDVYRIVDKIEDSKTVLQYRSQGGCQNGRLAKYTDYFEGTESVGKIGVNISYDNNLENEEEMLEILDKTVLSIRQIKNSEVQISQNLTSKSFSNFKLNINYPDNFKLLNVEEEKSKDMMGKEIGGELEILEFTNDILSFQLKNKDMEVSFLRYIYHSDYEPISPTGGGNLEINTILCQFETSEIIENCQKYFKIGQEKSIYRLSPKNELDEYDYSTELKTGDSSRGLSKYIRHLKVDNDYDGIMVSVKFLNQGLNLEQKEKYLEVVDEILLNI